MMLYEARVSEELQRVHDYALGLREKWQAGASVADLARDRDSLAALCDHTLPRLPEELARATNLRRHLGWMERNLSLDKPSSSESDINDICDQDLPILMTDFKRWCVEAGHYDVELRARVEELLATRQYDSAIRRAFIVLKARLVTVFGVEQSSDGAELVNQLFGKTSEATAFLSNGERQAMRDLLSGLYGLFRNPYTHHEVDAPFHDIDAVLAMINAMLKRLDSYRSRHGA